MAGKSLERQEQRKMQPGAWVALPPPYGQQLHWKEGVVEGKEKGEEEENGDEAEEEEPPGQECLTTKVPKILPADFLKQITNNFSSEKLGHSVFGTVYKGTLPNGDVIAVKKLAENSPVEYGQTFDTEVTNLIALRHKNIIELFGFCHETHKDLVVDSGRYVMVEMTERFLYYKYLPKGSLHKYIYDETSTINWKTRFKIIKGLCQGLHFLHERPDGPVIHMNLLPNTIWLDDNWEPKIADFGLSRLFDKGQTRINTLNVVGQNGYIAPEYLNKGEISTMSDIYSLGMIIIEITTKEKNCSNDADRSARQFVEKVRLNWKTDDQVISKYPSLDANGLRQVKTCIVIGLECVEADGNRRPSILDIVNKLNVELVEVFGQGEEDVKAKEEERLLPFAALSATDQGSLTWTLPTKLPAYFLKQITKNFSSEILGYSVFGTVYKLILV